MIFLGHAFWDMVKEQVELIRQEEVIADGASGLLERKGEMTAIHAQRADANNNRMFIKVFLQDNLQFPGEHKARILAHRGAGGVRQKH